MLKVKDFRVAAGDSKENYVCPSEGVYRVGGGGLF